MPDSSDTISAATDPARCPLCGESNGCGMAAGETTCWCFDLEISQGVLERVPPEARGVACVCLACSQARTPKRVLPVG